jgi:predicted AAA+ superfamily ATPase
MMGYMKNSKLFLDDIRIPKDAITLIPSNFNRFYFENDWDIVRSYNEFVQYIERNGTPEFVSFDHDLGDTAMDEYFRNVKTKGILDYDNIKEKTGFDCAKFLVEYCMDKNQSLPEYLVHSANPVGKKNIESYLENAKKHLSI